MKKVNKYRIIVASIFILVIIFFIFSITKYNSLEDQIKKKVEIGGLISVGIFSFILDFLPQYMPPHIFIVMNKLIGFNFILLLLLVTIGSSLGSLVGFEIGRRVKKGNSLLEVLGKKKVKLFEKNINGWKKWFVSLAAVSPLPYIPLILGMFNMSRKNFIIFGVIPRVIGLIILGIILM